jgi:hypothetical protein
MYARSVSVPAHRASDAEREAAADRLRVAAGDGRLDPQELEERLEAAYGARTVGELEALTGDLPAPARAAERTSVWRSDQVRERLAGFIIANTICVVIWLATDPGGYFWPMWVLLGTGIGLFSAVVRGALGTGQKHDDAHLPEPSGAPRLPGSPRG